LEKLEFAVLPKVRVVKVRVGFLVHDVVIAKNEVLLTYLILVNTMYHTLGIAHPSEDQIHDLLPIHFFS
jgi:hypothetical protein